jgi:methyl halide transferase
MTLDENFWNERYLSEQTGWDLGKVSPPIQSILDSIADKNLRVLIPGAGNAWEAEYAVKNGFTRVHIIDIAHEAILNVKERLPELPNAHLFYGDLFEHEGEYDLIIEQTFFCAINPSLRANYAKKMHELLVPGGQLRGVVFDAPMHESHPPFGGNVDEYRRLFEMHFSKVYFEPCLNSIAPRLGNEAIVHLIK